MHCVKAEAISTRLLSPEDKQDMLSGLTGIDALDAYVKIWIENGMPDVANGNIEPKSKGELLWKI